jgi:hypothetical protein
MSDPFTQISRTILSLLRGDADWAAIVRPGNVVDMTADSFERFKAQLQPADVPEVVLLQGDFRLQPFGGNSRLADLEQEYQMIVTHDSLRVRPVNVLKFQTMIALARGGAALGLDGLVRQWEITQGRDEAFGPKLWTRGTQRWTSILTIGVQLYFSREKLVTMSALS